MNARNQGTATLGLGLLIALTVFCASSGSAASYFLSPQGNDANPGTQQLPWKTLDRLQTAQPSLRPGDTIYFRGGDYVVTSAASRSYYSWRASGTATSPITYRNYDDEVATVVFDRRVKTGSAWVDALAYISGNHVVVDGLRFRQTEESRRLGMTDNIVTDRQYTPTAFYVYGSHVTIRNCVIDNFSGQGVHPSGSNTVVERCRIAGTGSHALYIVGRNGEFHHNVIDGSRGHSGQWGLQIQYRGAIGNKIHSNVLMNGRNAAILFSGSVSNNEVFNNVVVNGGSRAQRSVGVAIDFFCQVEPDGTGGVIGLGNKVFNNTFVGSTNVELISSGSCPTVDPDGPRGRRVDIFNNIFYPSTPIPVGLSLSNVHDNIFYNIVGSAPVGNRVVDPMLVNSRGSEPKDAMLRPGSPAIDRGVAGGPALDFSGLRRPRGSAIDLGAFEFAGGSPKPRAPAGLRVR